MVLPFFPFAGALSFVGEGDFTASTFSAGFATFAGISSAGFAPLLLPRPAVEVDGLGDDVAFVIGVTLGDAFDFAAGVSGI